MPPFGVTWKFQHAFKSDPFLYVHKNLLWKTYNFNSPSFYQEKLRNLKPVEEDNNETEGDFWKLSSMET